MIIVWRWSSFAKTPTCCSSNLHSWSLTSRFWWTFFHVFNMLYRILLTRFGWCFLDVEAAFWEWLSERSATDANWGQTEFRDAFSSCLSTPSNAHSTKKQTLGGRRPGPVVVVLLAGLIQGLCWKFFPLRPRMTSCLFYAETILDPFSLKCFRPEITILWHVSFLATEAPGSFPW